MRLSFLLLLAACGPDDDPTILDDVSVDDKGFCTGALTVSNAGAPAGEVSCGEEILPLSLSFNNGSRRCEMFVTDTAFQVRADNADPHYFVTSAWMEDSRTGEVLAGPEAVSAADHLDFGDEWPIIQQGTVPTNLVVELAPDCNGTQPTSLWVNFPTPLTSAEYQDGNSVEVVIPNRPILGNIQTFVY